MLIIEKKKYEKEFIIFTDSINLNHSEICHTIVTAKRVSVIHHTDARAFFVPWKLIKK